MKKSKEKPTKNTSRTEIANMEWKIVGNMNNFSYGHIFCQIWKRKRNLWFSQNQMQKKRKNKQTNYKVQSVLNLFSLFSKKPKILKSVEENNEVIKQFVGYKTKQMTFLMSIFQMK